MFFINIFVGDSYFVATLPGCFAHSRNFALGCHFAETDAAKAEGADVAALAPATETTPHDTGREFRFLFASSDDGCFSHNKV